MDGRTTAVGTGGGGADVVTVVTWMLGGGASGGGIHVSSRWRDGCSNEALETFQGGDLVVGFLR